MKLGKVALFALIFYSLIVSLHANDGFLVLTQAHSSSIESIAISQDANYGFSGDASGTVKVWDLNTNKTVRVIRVGRGEIAWLIAHPRKSEIAVVEDQGGESFRLSLWDWFDGRLIFNRSITALPQSILFSPQGSFLVAFNLQLNSIDFFESDTGRSIPYLGGEFGNVDFSVVSNSEQRIMTYNAVDGVIRYLELESADLLHETQSENRIEMLQILQNRRYAIGYKNQEIILIDLLNGETIDRAMFGSVEAIIPSQTGDEQFYIAQENGAQHSLSIISIDPDSSQPIRLRQRNALRVQGGDILYAASDTRTIVRPAPLEIASIENRRYRRLNTVEFDAIQSIILHGEWLYVHSSAGISRFPHRYIRAEEEDLQVQELQTIDLAIESPGGMQALDEENILMWDSEARDGIFLFAGDVLSRIPIQLFSPVRSLSVGEQYILVIDEENILYILDRSNNYEHFYSYQGVLINHAIEISQNRILISRQFTEDLPYSLIELNIESGEINPILSEDDRIISIQKYSEGFLVLGLSTDEGEVFTNVRRYSPDLEFVENIIQFPGAVDNAEILYSQGSLFSTVALEGVYEYSNREFRSFELDKQGVVSLYAQGNSLFAVNTDGSLSSWSLETGLLQSMLYFRQGSYVLALYPGEQFGIIEVPGRRNSLSGVLSSEIGSN